MGLFLKTIDYHLTQIEQLVHGTVIGTIGCLIEMKNVMLCGVYQKSAVDYMLHKLTKDACQ